jgi:hypothetical protein
MQRKFTQFILLFIVASKYNVLCDGFCLCHSFLKRKEMTADASAVIFFIAASDVVF